MGILFALSAATLEDEERGDDNMELLGLDFSAALSAWCVSVTAGPKVAGGVMDGGERRGCCTAAGGAGETGLGSGVSLCGSISGTPSGRGVGCRKSVDAWALKRSSAENTARHMSAQPHCYTQPYLC